jgi:uncharacterized membrane protein
MKKGLVIGGVVTTLVGILVLLFGIKAMVITHSDLYVTTHAAGALIAAIGFFIVGAGVTASPKTIHSGPSAL